MSPCCLGERVPEDNGATQLPRHVPVACGRKRAWPAGPAGHPHGQLHAGQPQVHRPPAQSDIPRLRAYTGINRADRL